MKGGDGDGMAEDDDAEDGATGSIVACGGSGLEFILRCFA